MGLQVRVGAHGGRSGVGEGVWIRGAGVGREAGEMRGVLVWGFSPTGPFTAFMGEDLGAIAADGGGERVHTLRKCA